MHLEMTSVPSFEELRVGLILNLYEVKRQPLPIRAETESTGGKSDTRWVRLFCPKLGVTEELDATLASFKATHAFKAS